jgi:hypothetical protein
MLFVLFINLIKIKFLKHKENLMIIIIYKLFYKKLYLIFKPFILLLPYLNLNYLHL